MSAYIVSCIAIGAYFLLFMFWEKGESIWIFEQGIGRRGRVAQILWAIAAICSVFSIYDGVVTGVSIEGKVQEPHAIAGALIGVLVFLALALITAIYPPSQK